MRKGLIIPGSKFYDQLNFDFFAISPHFMGLLLVILSWRFVGIYFHIYPY